jgi:hypothetical protein
MKIILAIEFWPLNDAIGAEVIDINVAGDQSDETTMAGVAATIPQVSRRSF